MDLESVRVFVKVAELTSFTRAGEHVGQSKSRVSQRVSELEAELGSPLLLRSTRAVRLTPDGELFLPRARRLVAEADELAAMFQAPRTLRGSVRIDLPINFARDVVIPRLPEFLAAHPQLEVLLSATDRRVDLVREGFDCVVRVGPLHDSGLVVRRLGVLPMANFASRSYLLQYGVPRSLDDLDRHLLVHYSTRFGSDAPGFEYRDGDGYRERPMRSVVTVNNADAYHAACVAGLGIMQTPRAGRDASVASGELVELLPEYTCEPMPVSLLHASGRNPPKRTRAVMGWLTQVFVPHLAAGEGAARRHEGARRLAASVAPLLHPEAPDTGRRGAPRSAARPPLAVRTGITRRRRPSSARRWRWRRRGA
jgi:DNA-binding transcriptional LysR family regulator